MLTCQPMPYLSVIAPKMSPQNCLASGTLTMPPLARPSKMARNRGSSVPMTDSSTRVCTSRVASSRSLARRVTSPPVSSALTTWFFSVSLGGWVHIATPGDSGLAAEYLLVKGDGLFCVTGEEQIGVERDGHDVGPFGQGPAVSRGCHTGVHVLSAQVHRTCCSGRQSAYCIRGAALRPGRDGPHTPT